MTQTFSTDLINNDLYLDANGNIVMVTGLQAVLETCSHAAKTILGEMVFQIDQGLPDFEAIWVGVPNIPQWELALTQALEAVQDVIEVISVEVIRQNNVLSYIATISTIYGTGSING